MPSPFAKYANSIITIAVPSNAPAVKDAYGNWADPELEQFEFKALLKVSKPTSEPGQQVGQSLAYLRGWLTDPATLPESVNLPLKAEYLGTLASIGQVRGTIHLELLLEKPFAPKVNAKLGQPIAGYLYVEGAGRELPT
jgi:hypothetical protein